jgi:hypothetical protein
MIPGDDCPEELVRYSSPTSVKKLAGMFQLVDVTQDWDILAADHARLAEFLDAYDDPRLDEDDRFALMELIIASLAEARQHGADIGGSWQRAEAFLRRDWRLHAATLAYWARGDDPDPERQFAITPEIRSVWREVMVDGGER